MNILFLGNFGKESILDRINFHAVLLVLKDDITEITIGSTLPFFTERTIFEEEYIIKELLGIKVSIVLFDCRKKRELQKYIKQSERCIYIDYDGPTSDQWLIKSYAFAYAKKKGRKTAYLNATYNSHFQVQSSKLVNKSLLNTDVIHYTNKYSRLAFEENFTSVLKSCDRYEDELDLTSSFISYFKINYAKKNLEKRYKNIAQFNILNQNTNEEFDDKEFALFTNQLNNCEGENLLLPFSYFFMNSDEREVYNEMKMDGKLLSFEVQNKPLGTEKTLLILAHAENIYSYSLYPALISALMNENVYVTKSFMKRYKHVLSSKFNFENHALDSTGRFSKLNFSKSKSSGLEKLRDRLK